MKKKNLISKVLVLALALVMVFTMTASAFASNAGVTVNVIMYGDTSYPMVSQTVSAADITSYLAAGKTHLYDTTGASASVPNIGYTAADVLYAGWQKEYGSAADSSQIDIGWDNAPATGAPGAYFTVYGGMSADAGDYYYVGMTEDGLYEYYWRGDSWNLYIDGQFASMYATSYAVSNISSVVFDYNTTRSENFTLDYYIQGCLNASEDIYN